MIEIGKTLISEEVVTEAFVCDLNRCKGACCVEGDLGAPLAKDELCKIDSVIETVKPYLSTVAVESLNKEGGYVLDEDGEYSTTTLRGRECVFAFYDDQMILKCSIEQAHRDGKIDFKKPMSCHLYPIRVKKLHGYDALNYDIWLICSSACTLGKRLKIPVYQFLREALIRKYGESWYQSLEQKIKDRQNQKYPKI